MKPECSAIKGLFRLSILMAHQHLMAILCQILFIYTGCPRGVMVKVMDCEIVVNEFVPQSVITFTFTNTLGKRMNPFILPAMG